MKLRIKGNAIRLRLTRTDVEQLEAAGRVEEALHLPGGRRLVYALQVSQEVQALAARFEGEALTLFMPAAWAQTWTTTNRVGYEGTQVLEEGGALALLVEKDFQCLHKRPDEEDAFPHPLADEHERRP